MNQVQIKWSNPEEIPAYIPPGVYIFEIVGVEVTEDNDVVTIAKWVDPVMKEDSHVRVES